MSKLGACLENRNISAEDKEKLIKWQKAHIDAGLSELEADRKTLLDYHKHLFDEMNDLRGALAISKEKYVPFDNKKELAEIEKKYTPKIEAQPVTPEVKQAESTQPIVTTAVKTEAQKEADMAEQVLRAMFKEQGLEMPEEWFVTWRKDNFGADANPLGGYRIVIGEHQNISTENIAETKKWFEDRFNIPFHVVDNLIKTTNGGYAYGEFRNAAVYIAKNAEIGTAYHEAFETVWGMFLNNKQQDSIYDEFKSRQGTYIDRESGNQVKYSSATKQQAKEQIAEEFRDYNLSGKLTVKPVIKKNFIQKFFAAIKSFIDKFIFGKENIEEVFRKINAGYYKTTSPVNSTFQQGYRTKIGTLDASTSYKLVQGITNEVVRAIFNSTESIVGFDNGSIKTDKIYSQVLEKLGRQYSYLIGIAIKGGDNNAAISYAKIWKSIQDSWKTTDGVQDSVDAYLATMGIVRKQKKYFKSDTAKAYEASLEENEDSSTADNTDNNNNDEGDEFVHIDRESPDNRADSYVSDHFHVDWKKSITPSVKILVQTLTENEFGKGEENGIPTIQEKLDEQTGLTIPVKAATVYNTLLRQLGKYNTIEEKAKQLLELGKKYPNFIQLYNKLRLNKPNRTEDETTLLARFMNVFSKQTPEGLVNYIDGNKVYTRSSNTSTQADNVVKDWITNMKSSKGAKKVNNIYIFSGIPKDISVRDDSEKMKFLDTLGISFTQSIIDKLTGKDLKKFRDAVDSIKSTLSKRAEGNKPLELIMKDGYSLSISGPLNKLAEVYVNAEKSEFDSTFTGMSGKQRQASIPNSGVSNMLNDLNNSKTLSELTEKLPHLKSTYSKDSIYLNEELYNKEGEKTDKQFTLNYVEGTKDNNRGIETKDLTEHQRLLQEINGNLEGRWYVLVPADASTEYTIDTGNKIIPISSWQENKGGQWQKIARIIDKYDETEKELPNKERIISAIRNRYKQNAVDAFKSYVKELVDSTIQYMKDYHYIDSTGKVKGINTDFIDKYYKEGFKEEQLRDVLEWRTINYVINNIELTKIFFGDPSQFTKLGDKYLKVFKSWQSPRQNSIYGDKNFTNHLNETKNKAGDVTLKQGDPGYHQHGDIFKTIVENDVIKDIEQLSSIHKAYKDTNTSDAQSLSPLPGYREIRLRATDWMEKDEIQYQYEMALDRQMMAKDKLYKYNNDSLRYHDELLLAKGDPKASFFPVYKPIYSGFSHAENPEDITTVLDKTSTAPMFYSHLREHAPELAKKLANMYKADITYSIFISGRKVGAANMRDFTDHSPIKANEITHLNYRYYGKQVETNKAKDSTTRGSQLAKEAYINLLDNGVPKDYSGTQDDWFKLTEQQRRDNSSHYNKIRHNVEILQELTKQGYSKLIKKIGIKDTGEGYEFNKGDFIKLLKDELSRRELPENIKDALGINPETNEFITPLETLPNYSQIKSILFSYVDKHLVRPKMHGGDMVQVSGAGYNLKYYAQTEDGIAKAEVLLPNFIRKKLKELGYTKSDEELISYLNSTQDGKDVLTAIGFRIPTDELHSAEVMIIKGFLKHAQGNTAVVADGITTKAGSDFDVDKLNTYLKNVYIDTNGNPKVIPFKGVSQEAVNELDKLAYTLKDFSKEKSTSLSLDDIDSLDELTDDESYINSIDDLYYKSLENGYFHSLEDLILDSKRFERLTKPTRPKPFKAFAEELAAISEEEFGESGLKNITNPLYMSKYRHYFVAGKGIVGVAATAQTGHTLRQLSPTIIDAGKITDEDRKWLGNGDILLPHNTITFNGKSYPSLSGILDRDGEYISDGISDYVTGGVDIANDPSIIKARIEKNTIAIHALMTELGIPSRISRWFMVQPMITEYLKTLKREGYSWVLSEQIIENFQKDNFKSAKKTSSIDATKLKQNVEQYYGKDKKSFTAEQNAEQQLIFKEFLKYTRMAQHMFDFTQGMTWDTTRYQDSSLIHLKEQKYEKAKKSIISNINHILSKSFVGTIKDATLDFRDAIAENILPLENAPTRDYLNSILNNFVNKGVQIYQRAAKKIEQSLFSHLIQTKTGRNQYIKSLFVEEQTNLVDQLTKLKNELPQNSDIVNNLILKNLYKLTRERAFQTKNLKIIANNDKATQDAFAEAMRDLKNNPLTEKFYRQLVRFSILQSGTSTSNISFTKLIPTEDYSEIIKSIIPYFADEAALRNFTDTDAFYRNNWKDNIIVPYIQEATKETEEGDNISKQMLGNKQINDLIRSKGLDPNVYMPIKVSMKNRKTQSPFLTMKRNREVYSSAYMQAMTGEDYAYPNSVKKDKQFFQKTILYKRIDESEGKPLIHTIDHSQYANTTLPHDYALYIPVNAWGDGQFLQEYYETAEPSQVDNNTMKFVNSQGFGVELSTEEFLNAYHSKDVIKPAEVKADPTKQSLSNEDKINLHPCNT